MSKLWFRQPLTRRTKVRLPPARNANTTQTTKLICRMGLKDAGNLQYRRQITKSGFSRSVPAVLASSMEEEITNNLLCFLIQSCVAVDPTPAKSYVVSGKSSILHSETEGMMDRLKLTHESRCLVILIGGVLEQCIEDRARSIAANRAAEKIAPEDINKATTEFLGTEFSDLPHLIEQAIDNYQHRSSKAA